MKNVKILTKFFLSIILFNNILFASDFEKFNIDINKNKINDEILITYKDYFLKNKKIDLKTIKELDDIEELYQIIKFDIYVDDKVTVSFNIKAIKYLQDNYLNGYSYEINSIKDNGFILNVNTNTSYNYKLFFLYQNKFSLKYMLVSSIFQEEYKICSYPLDIDISYNLIDIETLTKNRKFCYFDSKDIDLSVDNVPLYNNTAYYLQQANANDEAIFLLEKIIEKFPNRTVAYLNLADAYLGKNESEKAKQNYEKYINLMKQDNKESKIPQRVLEFK